MGIRLANKLAILHKLETTYGVSAAPAAANALLVTNPQMTPLEGEEVSRDLLLPYLGNQGVILTGKYASIEFDVEIAGAGTAGTAPKYGSLLRICGMAEVVQAGTSVTYSIVEDAQESGTLFFNQDGVQHIMLGCRGTVTANFAPKQIPKYRFKLTGLLGTVTDAPLPLVSQAGWTAPVESSSANTTLTLHGIPSVAESLSLDLGNTVTPRFLIGSEGIIISDRKSTGNAVLEARLVQEADWFGKAISRTRGALSLTHGKTAGNIVQFSAPAVEIGKPNQGETDKIVNLTLPLSLCPVTGRDELSIVVK
ncbi:MAG: hypothetical protein DI498_10985 [Paracoccus denitrificans]|nr:MAG: hypothetical protein DI498_10985 [Paracoccus denitrificans]PZO83666.1 MAG: hypothetical protein DI633_10985 [Paracoccus denitrificans]